MKKVGFIGLGIMGKPMAINLINAGYEINILNSSKAAADLTPKGATAYHSCKEVAENSEIIITMLPDSPEVNEVVFSDKGVLAGVKSGSIFVDMSTIAPSTAREVAEAMLLKGVDALDAPVSGGQVGAESGNLSIMVGGKQSAFDAVKPLFEVMGKSAVLIGDAGAGQLTKACNQMIVGMTIQAVAESFTLAKKAGVNLEKMREALLGGFAQSRILDLHGQRIIDRNFEPGFKIKLHRKDMNIALMAGKEFKVPLYGSALVASHMDAVLAAGWDEKDHSALALLMEKLSNVD
ncbi:2-hydroxy-3-oxopropionate reductase [Cyclobacterium amurskyense]|jgi:2-hydroxy-3-oxopropionate reductase|uniref:2-hydroxy-3-oxopropionate reductase n=1 Tax=Cyclobacterium amurskyense TaxID=320787 RepID=A0A0H4PK59_9BACT|nr:2-hydroxy-3-oxopropionate reductase [Cyclobacterium amurskyense]AKP53440.1 2-hydroxy-3-oxopropionate reductase [Cyclobacterium amurskyense]|tara:strand:- start:49237 stop:50112 length:876 start_codon:yes stop_codon:yes gene_type:complete